MACNSKEEKQTEILDDMSWCLCGHCVHDTHIEEKICCKNPLILPEEKFNGFDCITQSEAFRNVCLDKDVL